MNYKIVVPPGIGDFSWLWSKLSTTKDTYEILYAGTPPERLGALLALLPKEKVVSFKQDPNYRFFFDRAELKASFAPGEIRTVERYADMEAGELNFLEPNTHLERGNRIEYWLPDIKTTDFHYKINGLIDNPSRANYFIVHLSSFKVKEIWNTYEVAEWIEIINAVQQQTGWTPIFIGAQYDDYAQACFEAYIDGGRQAISMIGRTGDLLSALCLIQQSKFFLGCVSSGITMLANVLNTPSASWWPRPLLPFSWADMAVPYKWFLWKDAEKDRQELCSWLKHIS